MYEKHSVYIDTDLYKITKTIFNILLQSILYTAVIIMLIMVVFGIKAFNVVSGSMTPTINIDDIIIVVPLADEDYAVGDIVTFNHSTDFIVTHRIVAINGDGTVTTRGDAVSQDDASDLEISNIIGKVIVVLPNYGTYMDWVKENIWICIIGIFVIYYSCSLITQLYNENKYFYIPLE